MTPDAMSEPAAFSAKAFAEVSASRMIDLLGFDEFRWVVALFGRVGHLPGCPTLCGLVFAKGGPLFSALSFVEYP